GAAAACRPGWARTRGRGSAPRPRRSWDRGSPRRGSSRRLRAPGRARPSKRHLRPLVAHAASLVVPARERAGLADVDGDADAEPEPEILREPRSEPAALGERERRRGVDANQDVVEPLLA